MFRTGKVRAIARSRRELLKTPLDFKIGSVGVKCHRSQVGYLSEKSMRIIDFLPKYHWFPGQKCLKNQWKSMKIKGKSMKINENQAKINKNQWKSMKITENPWKSMKNNEKSMKINAQSSPEQPRAAQSDPEQPREAQSSLEQPRAAQGCSGRFPISIYTNPRSSATAAVTGININVNIDAIL